MLKIKIDEKKKLNSRFGEIEINKNHTWSNGLNGMQISPYLQELQAFSGQSDNYTLATEQLEKYLRIPISRSQTERVTKCYAEELEEEDGLHLKSSQEEKIIELKSELSSKDNVYSMVDGGMLQTREGVEHNDWKEVKLGRIFSDKDIFELDKHHNWIKNSVYCGHLGDSASFLDKFEPLTDLLDDLRERLVFIADGATWIWRWITENYPNATQILDFFHGMEHISKFAKLQFKEEQTLKAWIAKQKVALLNDKIAQVIEEIEGLKCSKSVDNKRKVLLTYLRNNQHRMLYKTYQEKGLRIGSGAIESAHRTVIQKRMKQSGQRWTIDGAQKIIDLRLMNINQQWEYMVDLIKQKERDLFQKAA